MAYHATNAFPLHHDTLGDRSDPPIILMGGFSNQTIAFSERGRRMLAAAGLFVVRVDLRDCGRSPHLPADATYTFTDMTRDVIALIAELRFESAHLLGAGLGAAIAQIAAHDHPERVASITCVSANSGEPEFGRPSRAVLELFNSVLSGAFAPDVMTLRLADLLMALDNGGVLTPPEALALSAEIISRDAIWESSGRVLGAVFVSAPRTDLLRAITQPTLVIHGRRDPLVSISGGRRVAALVRHSTFLEVPEMGHYLSNAFWDAATDVIADHVRSAARITSG